MLAPNPPRASTTIAQGVRVPLGERAPDLGIEWDAEDRLTAVKEGPSTLASFAYDASGRRTSKTAGAVTTSFVYDGAQFLEERPSSGATKRYVYGPGIDRVLAQSVGNVTSYFVADHLGSIVQVTDSLGVPTLIREYDPWGNLLQGSSTSGYAFTGRERESETNLYYYRARYYDPTIGRFLSEDSYRFAAGVNFYAYVLNNPVNRVDPTGHIGLPRTCPQRIHDEVQAEYCKKGGGDWKRAKDDPNCREAHCVANCRITRECPGGSFTAAAASAWKEFQDTWDPTSGGGWDQGDQAANKKGRVCGSSPYTKGYDCEILCQGTR